MSRGLSVYRSKKTLASVVIHDILPLSQVNPEEQEFLSKIIQIRGQDWVEANREDLIESGRAAGCL